MNSLGALSTAIALALAACVRAPNVAVVDQKTALERQAAGGYPALENDLEQAGMAPSPEPLVREELSGSERGSPLGELAQLYAKAESDADVIDRLLVAQCVGEALSGLLVPRSDDCTNVVDTVEMTRVLGSANLHRRQLWQLIASEQGAPIEDVLPVWRGAHLQQVVCGALVETSKGWSPKAC